MARKETLKDGRKVVIKDLKMDDLGQLMDFYRSMPPEDRNYLRVDVTDEDVVRHRMKLMDTGCVFRIVALDGKRIVGDGALELSEEDWRQGQGELRVIVAKPYQHKGLGMLMMRELTNLAMQKNIDRIIVKMARPQVAARKICQRLGFREQHVLPDYVRDRTGHRQDLIIMTCDIKELWQEMEHFYGDSDWQRCR